MPVFIDARPAGANLAFRPGTTLTVDLEWPDGFLAGRTFTSTLDGDPLDLSIAGDVMTIEVSQAITSTITTPVTWLLLEDRGGDDPEPVIIGSWAPSLDAATQAATITVITDEAASIELTVSTGGHPATAEAGAVPILRGTAAAPSDWTRWLFTSDATAPDSALSVEHGQLVARVVGGSGVQSNRREVWQIPGFPSVPYSRIRSRWASHPPADGTIEHGHMHALQTGDDGRIRAAIVWDFSFGLVLGGVWESDPDGSDFLVEQAPTKDSESVTAASRTSGGVVTLTVATGAQSRWATGDAISVDMSDNTYDGSFILSAVADTTLTYTQTNGGSDADGGTGTVTLLGADGTNTVARTWAFTDAARSNGIVTASGMAAGHPFQIGDRVTIDGADATYDARNLPVTGVNIFTGQVSWAQPGVANDTNAGAGTISKASPYWVESRLLPGGILQARIAPDIGVALNGSTGGPLPSGFPPWESRWTRTWDLTRLTSVDAPTGEGYVGLVAAHHSSASPVRYDSIEAWSIRA